MAGDHDIDAVLPAAQAGAEWALSSLYRTLTPSLCRFLNAQAPGHGDDLAQETWLAAAGQIRRFEGDGRAFRAWLFTIARRQLITHWRVTGRRPSFGVDPEELVALAGADPALSDARPDQAMVELLAGLPHDQAEIVLLRVVAGLSAEQVGVVVGKSAGAVRVIQHRALQHMARRFSEKPVTP